MVRVRKRTALVVFAGLFGLLPAVLGDTHIGQLDKSDLDISHVTCDKRVSKTSDASEQKSEQDKSARSLVTRHE